MGHLDSAIFSISAGREAIASCCEKQESTMQEYVHAFIYLTNILKVLPRPCPVCTGHQGEQHFISTLKGRETPTQVNVVECKAVIVKTQTRAHQGRHEQRHAKGVIFKLGLKGGKQGRWRKTIEAEGPA